MKMVNRRILKTISYRVVGTITTVCATIIAGLPIEIAGLVGISELILKPVLYYIHEIIWDDWIWIN
jgi:uncharacterized membrane protein